jgi:DNA-binding transcriptional ArsR family regulator
VAKNQTDHYALTARIMKAVAQPIRLAILDSLRDGERCVCDIARAVGAERSNVSRHLAVLAGAGILASRKRGLQVFYELRTPCILNVFGCVREVIKADVEAGRRALCCI